MHEFGRESDVVEIITRLERVSAETQLLKELFAQKDERISQLTSELGELRGLVVKAESANQSNVMRLEKLDSMLKNLDPMEIEKTLAMREKVIVEAQANVEKVERMLEDLRSSYVEMASKIDKLGNFESISKVYKDVDAALSNVKRKENHINLQSGKVETTFFEMEKRLLEFEKAKPLIERTEDLSNEMIKNLSDLNIKMSSFPNRDEIEEIRKNIGKQVKEDNKSLEEQVANAVAEIDAIKKAVMNESEDAASVKGLTDALKNSVDKIEVESRGAVARLSEEIGEIRASMAELPSRAGEPTTDVSELEGSIRQDLEALKADVEDRLTRFSADVESLKEGSGELGEAPGSDVVARLSEEIGEIRSSLVDLSSRVEHSAAGAPDTGEFDVSLRQDLERFKEEIAAKLSQVSESMESLKERSHETGFQLEEGPSSDAVSSLSGEIDELRSSLVDLSSKVEQAPVGAHETGEVDVSLKQDFERFKSEVEERLSSVHTPGVFSREHSLKSKVQMKDFESMFERMEDELQRLSTQVESGSQEDVEDRIFRVEETLRGLNDSVNALSVKSSTPDEAPRVDIQDLTDAQKEFENNIKLKLLQIREDSDAAVKSAIEELTSRVEQAMGAQGGEGVEDLERFKAEVEERLSSVSNSMDTLKERSVESAERLSEASASIKWELENLARQVESGSEMDSESKGRLSGVEDALKSLGDSVGGLSEKFSSLGGGPDEDIQDIKDAQKEFENNIKLKMLKIREASEEAIRSALAKLSSDVEKLPVTVKEAQELQESIKENFSGLKEEVETKLSQVSTSVHVSREQSQGAVERLNELSASLKYLENMNKELKEKLEEVKKESEEKSS